MRERVQKVGSGIYVRHFDDDNRPASVEVPLVDGAPFIPAMWVVRNPALLDMIERQSNFWRVDGVRDGYVGPAEGA